MVLITVDGQPYSVSETPPTNDLLFAQLREGVLGQGRIVVSVQIDDQAITWNDGSPLWKKGVEQTMSMAVTTDRVDRMSSSLLELVNQQLAELRRMLKALVVLLREGPPPEINEHVLRAMGIWQQLQVALDRIRQLNQLGGPRPTWQRASDSLDQAIQSLADCLREFDKAVRLGQQPMATSIEQQFLPLVDQWTGVSQLFLQTLQAESSIEPL